MNIVAAMKQIADLQQIRIRDRKPVLDGAPKTFGNLDKNALEAGVQLKDATDGKVIVLAAGNEDLEDTVKEALAAGGDEAVLVIDPKLENMDSAQSARVLAAALNRIEGLGIILFGEGSGDNYSGQVASRVAMLLGVPAIGYAKEIVLDENKVRVTRALENCEEIVEVEQFPVVISVVAEINEIPIPSVMQILKAGKKTKHVLSLSELDVELSAGGQIKTISNLAPIMNRKGIKIKTVDELVKALQAEGIFGGN